MITRLYPRLLPTAAAPTTPTVSGGPQNSGLSSLSERAARVGERRAPVALLLPATVETPRSVTYSDRMVHRQDSVGRSGVEAKNHRDGLRKGFGDALDRIGAGPVCGGLAGPYAAARATRQGWVAVRCAATLTRNTVGAFRSMPIWARKDSGKMPATGCTVDAMEAFDDFREADDRFALLVFRAIEDRMVTDDELVGIRTAELSRRRTRNALHLAVETCHRGVTLAMGYLRVGRRTPKLERTERELTAGIISLEERLREREAPVPA